MGRRSNAQIASDKAVAVTTDTLITAALAFVDCEERAPVSNLSTGATNPRELYIALNDAAIAFRSALEAKARAYNGRESSAAP